MKHRIVLAVLALLVPAIAFAQAPVPTPSAAPSKRSATPAIPADVAVPMMDDQQEMYPRQPQPPQPPQPPQRDLGKWWKNSDVVRELQLTEAQITQIEQTFLEHRLKLIDLRADVERQETRLQPLIEADRPDEAKVGAQIDLLLAARGKLEKENAMMMLAIRRVLSVEQWKKLESMQQMRERSRFKEPYPPQQPGPGMRRPAPQAPGSTPLPRPPDSDR